MEDAHLQVNMYKNTRQTLKFALVVLSFLSMTFGVIGKVYFLVSCPAQASSFRSLCTKGLSGICGVRKSSGVQCLYGSLYVLTLVFLGVGNLSTVCVIELRRRSVVIAKLGQHHS